MAITSQLFYRGPAAVTNATLYTATSNAVVTNIVATNPTSSSQYFTVNMAVSGNNYAIVSSGLLLANNTTFIDFKQYLQSGQLVTGNASSTSINFHISGVTGV